MNYPRNPLVDYDALAAYGESGLGVPSMNNLNPYGFKPPASAKDAVKYWQGQAQQLAKTGGRVVAQQAQEVQRQLEAAKTKAAADALEAARYLADPVRKQAEAQAQRLLSAVPGNAQEKAKALAAFTGLMQGKLDVAALEHLGTDLGKKALYKYGEQYGKPALQKLLSSVPVKFPSNIPVNEAVWAVGYQILSGHYDPVSMLKAAAQVGEKYILAQGQKLAIEEGTKLAGSFVADAVPYVGPAVQLFTSGNPFKGADPSGVINCYIVTWPDVLEEEGRKHIPNWRSLPAGAAGSMYAGYLGFSDQGRNKYEQSQRTTWGGLPDPRFHIIGGSIGFQDVDGAWNKEVQAAANFIQTNCKDNPYMAVANQALTLVASLAGGPLTFLATSILTVASQASKTFSQESGDFKRRIREGKQKAINATIKYLKDSGEWRRIITARQETSKTNALVANLTNPVRLTFLKGTAKSWPSPEPTVTGVDVSQAIHTVIPKPGTFVSSDSLPLYGHPFTIEYFVDGKWKKAPCGPYTLESQVEWSKCGPSPKPAGSYQAVLDAAKKAGAYNQAVVENPAQAEKVRASIVAAYAKSEKAKQQKQEAFVQSDAARIAQLQKDKAAADAKRRADAAPAADRAAAAKFAGKTFTAQQRAALLKKTQSDLSMAYFQCGDKTACPDVDRLLAEIRWLQGKQPAAPVTPPVKRTDQKVAQLQKEIVQLKKQAAAAQAARIAAQQAVRANDTQRQQAISAGLSPAQAAAAMAPLRNQTVAAINQATQAAATLSNQAAQVQKAAQVAQVPMSAVQQVLSKPLIAAPQRPLVPIPQQSFSTTPFVTWGSPEPAQPAVPTDRPDLFLPFLRW